MAALAEDPVVREAARWFMRMVHAPADHAQRGRFEAWLLASPRHAEEYTKFSELWADFDSTARLERLARACEDQRKSEAAKQGSQAKTRRALLAGGVVSGIGALLGWRLIPFADDGPVLSMARSTLRRQTLTQALPDGSSITLAPEGRLELQYFRTHRDVSLHEGDALFEVARDPQRPFTVSCAQARVRVLGTKFVVSKLAAGTVRVSVLEGQVRLAREATAADRGPDGSPAGLVLAAGEVAELRHEGELHRVQRHAGDAQSWRQGRLVFDADPLSDVIRQLSRFSARPLVLDPRPASLPPGAAREVRITAVVQLRDVDAFVRKLPDLAPLRLHESAAATHLTPQP